MKRQMKHSLSSDMFIDRNVYMHEYSPSNLYSYPLHLTVTKQTFLNISTFPFISLSLEDGLISLHECMPELQKL